MIVSSGANVIFVPRFVVSPTMIRGRGDVSLGEIHFIYFAILVHLDDHFFGQGAYAGDAYAMKAAGDLIGVFIELAAGMQDRHHHF